MNNNNINLTFQTDNDFDDFNKILKHIISDQDKEKFIFVSQKLDSLKYPTREIVFFNIISELGCELANNNVTVNFTLFAVKEVLKYETTSSILTRFLANYYLNIGKEYFNPEDHETLISQINTLQWPDILSEVLDHYLDDAKYSFETGKISDTNYIYNTRILFNDINKANIHIDVAQFEDHDFYNKTIELALQYNDSELIQLLQKAGIKITSNESPNILNDINHYDKDGETILTRCLLNDPSLDDIREIVDQMGADINLPNEEGFYPIEFIFYTREQKKDYTDILNYFIDRQVNVNSINHFEETPLISALRHQVISLSDCTNESEKEFVHNTYNKYISILLDAGADPKPIELDGLFDELIYYTGTFESIDLTNTLKLLINKGMPVETALFSGMTPAQIEGAGITCQFDINARNSIGETFFTSSDNYEFIQSFEKYHPDFNLTNSDGETPLGLHIANSELPLKLINYLLEHGANPNLLSDENPPLIILLSSYATIEEKSRIIPALLNHGADVTIPGKHYPTSFHAALHNCHSLIPILRKYVNKAPANLNETLLFKGENAMIEKFNRHGGINPDELSETLTSALLLRASKATETILQYNNRLDWDYSQLKPVDYHYMETLAYPLDLLAFIKNFSSPVFLDLWKDVIKTDNREEAKQIAESAVYAITDEYSASTIIHKINSAKKETIDKNKAKTRQFFNLINQLFANLKDKNIFAVDIDGRGWAPGDHGREIAEGMLCSEKHICKTLGIAKRSDAKVCYTDLNYYKSEAEQFSDDENRHLVTNAYIYYYGPDQNSSKEIAHEIVTQAKALNLDADWNGNTSSAVYVSILL